MKKIFLLLMLMLSSKCFALSNNIENALDGGSRAIGFSIDSRVGSTANYYSMAVTVTSNTTYDVYSYLNRFASAGMLLNDSLNDITANISVNGSTFGQDIVVKTTESLDLSFFIIWKKIKITAPSTSNLRILVR